MFFPCHLATVVPDDDGQRGHDNEDRPSRSQTPGKTESDPTLQAMMKGLAWELN